MRLQSYRAGGGGVKAPSGSGEQGKQAQHAQAHLLGFVVGEGFAKALLVDGLELLDGLPAELRFHALHFTRASGWAVEGGSCRAGQFPAASLIHSFVVKRCGVK